jgi:hypothetical protein
VNPENDRRIGVRSLSLIALVLLTAVLAACGGQSKPKPPPGSPDNPLVAQADSDSATSGRLNEAAPAKGTGTSGATSEGAAKAEQPGYQKLVERQGRKPRSRFTPCNLVTKAQAGAIVGAPLQDPLEAPQGPTCIYRSRDGKRFVTLAVQPLELSKLKRQMRKRHQVSVSDKTAYCGMLGQPILYVSLSRNRVLSVAAPCKVAQRFATTAVQRLND